ncbi:exo-beta-D-glucosaminidase [Bisporella sp. PMI_857]|nr:exo-beta-D-glucosaminidase [Bisporella sp. PMI_857]
MLRFVCYLAACRVALGKEDGSIASNPGDTTVIPGWHMQSSAIVTADMIELSKPDADVSSWYRVGSHSTVMAGLLENGVYNDTALFFSDNLETMVKDDFSVPWLYREEIFLSPRPAQNLFLETNGISSKADVYVNGHLLASEKILKGAYGGRKLDITALVNDGKNAILIKTYPTNYLRDFALGFVDWNPYPPDNGTGVWREVAIARTGVVSLSKPRIVTDYKGEPHSGPVKITINIVVSNNKLASISGRVEGTIKKPNGGVIPVSRGYNLSPRESKTISLTVTIKDPDIWWPKQWGSQPLYTLNLSTYAGFSGALSDRAEPRTFGIRHVVSYLSANNDTSFSINGHSFHVRGAGYSADMFLRFSTSKLEKQFSLMHDIGLNTVRLEGKQEHPGFYSLADRMGIMVMAGWECCDKWEGWTYNNDAAGEKWTEDDYVTARMQMRHEGALMQGHPSMLAFLVGSDYWPDERATKEYLKELRDVDWDVPIIASAAMRGWPQELGPSGMKMDGPYDWVPPNYWYGDQLGAAFGFGSELGAGVGTPELSSLTKFLTSSEINDLWTAPDKGHYHMSTSVSQFYDRSIYNKALYTRYGSPGSLKDYLLKAQISDYEATRSQYEAYSIRQSAERPASGLVYWMLNNAWPSLHWNLFDYYLKGAGSYYGAKTGSRSEHVAFEYASKNGDIWIINHTLEKHTTRVVNIDLISLDGKSLVSQTVTTSTEPIRSKYVASLREATTIGEPAFLRLVLKDEKGDILSRNVYWLAPTLDKLDWDDSTWYYTPVTSYANYTALFSLPPTNLSVVASDILASSPGKFETSVELKNKADVPAFFTRLELTNRKGQDILPAYWDDNYVTLWPGESLGLKLSWIGDKSDGALLRISGVNVADVRDLELGFADVS